MAVLATAKVGSGFRVTIPKEVRDLLELEEGEELLFFETEGWIKRICLRKHYTS
ncbi:AbrB/MazE/SpoVT family DNA-binding domain-containing protein [Candidatus Bathyarchaeota archaeon]|nr:AbrB/MazE/SpoVT family DNA-binding domain-containing protein [Candidatus Bathyarchaeota archaeon]NIU80849.1 AbrB/MazE/SpoVT family DNA-binding domain-containing protein [Candidatus Bathyarchaeota archaeon]NIV67481.1 AbrB/MazE/SpoVT family DNA-binding domain-containing protein [Candidatus Bathyarchaeota archaeon]NIW16136.1 AbrB/MazE/SpoVT family DNA-binding domain-containing protein [Candidatus Bathyarchaeota archaeon]NIW34127.1 AbrB/MazE/SpoVT family DNA-binding domain-containing protein [Ca